MVKQAASAVSQTQVDDDEREKERVKELLKNPVGSMRRAVRKGNVGDVKFLVEYGASTKGMLQRALDSRQLGVVEALIRLGVDVDSKDKDGWTALMFAACNGHVDAVAELIRKKADVNAKDKDGKTALMLAVEEGHVKVAAKLMQHEAAVNAKDKDGWTALMFAARNGYADVVAELIRQGADVDAMEESRTTALMFAARHSHTDVVVKLTGGKADVNAADESGATALMFAAREGHNDLAAELVRLGADVNAKNKHKTTVLMAAARNGHVDVVAELILHGADVNATAKGGRTALMFAAEKGRVKAAAELIRLGADVNTTAKGGKTTLMLAAVKDRVKVVAELIRLGADVNAKDKDGKTALILAVEEGHVDVAAKLMQHGANVDVKDKKGKTALMIAAKKGHAEVGPDLESFSAAEYEDWATTGLADGIDTDEVKDEQSRRGTGENIKDTYGTSELMIDALLRRSAFDQLSPSNDEVALFVIAVVGDVAVLRKLVTRPVDINFVARDGRTALFYAAEYGRTKAVQLLLDNGACATTKSHASNSQSQRECETPLTLAGRDGHMHIFETLVKAGAPVNVRSATDGETPLISVARFGNFPAVSLLVAHGGDNGVLCFEDVQDDEYPLLPGSLATMEAMCATVAFELEPVCTRMMMRLQTVCSAMQQQRQQQQQQDSTAASTDRVVSSMHYEALVTFACIVYRACRLLFEIEKKRGALSRFVASRAIQRRIQDIDDELSSLVRMQGLTLGEASAVRASQLDNDDSLQRLQLVQSQFEQALSFDDALLSDDDGVDADSKYGTAMLLQYELAAWRREQSTHAQASAVEAVLARFLRVCEMEEAPDVPDWFISHDDLEFHSWNIAETDNKVERYAGKWRGAIVTIEISTLDSDAFAQAAAQWHRLNHPNIVKLFGAYHIGDPSFFVYESTPGELPLHEFLRVSESNPALTWKLLYDAALGLQYLHSQGVAHGCLQSETIIVGSDLVARLSNIGGDRQCFNTLGRDEEHWIAPEIVPGTSVASMASDIFAFAMCIWEAVTSKLPWRGVDDWEFTARVQNGVLSKRPEIMRLSVWKLMNEMYMRDPSERVGIKHVVRRLKKFMLKHENTVSGGTSNSPTSPSADSQYEPRSQRLDELKFHEFDVTFPNALAIVKARCERLSDEPWLFTSVVPALEFVFGLLQEREMTLGSDEVKAFCAVLACLWQYTTTTNSIRSERRQMRSRKVAEAHRLVYAKLDSLLDMLRVSKEDAIRVWRLEVTSSIANPVGADLSPDHVGGKLTKPSQRSSGTVTLKHLGTPPEIHEQWTREGLAKIAASAPSTWRPKWYLSLSEVVFSEADKIGQGAFGAVYKGRWLDTQVVIKFMGYEDDFKTSLTDIDTISTDLLLHEVRVWHRLNHPHVLKLFGASHVDKRHFVCEYASGGNLVAYLNKQPDNKQLKWQKLHEAALGLQYLHSMGVAHNDLKWDNIMVGADDKAKIIDFGLSCLLGEAEIQFAVGAVNWRSPECLAGGRPSYESDVYSFAMCIIAAVSGEMPWGRGMKAVAIKSRVEKGKTPPLPKSMTAKQRNLIELMTKLEPSERVSMAFVVNKLDEIAHDKIAHDKIAHDDSAGRAG